MKQVLVIGSGISGLACATACAREGLRVTLVSPFPSERSQSVMAAGGINAALRAGENGDSVASHIEDTLKSGRGLSGVQAVTGLCEQAEQIIRYLERIGTVFSLDEQGHPARRAFGGQSHRRTFYCGASTGKQIVTSLAMEGRRYEAAGLIVRRIGYDFHSALIRDGVCYGALLYHEKSGRLEAFQADATVMAVGGQNALFGKTTGSMTCDGYAAGRLLMQGAVLKNLEFIQYHPTTLETPQKRMLVSEACRGEGGRLFVQEGSARRYFMEEKYGPGGNLMTRDVISREIEAAGGPVFLDVSFLDRKIIDHRLAEVRDLCRKYRGIDIAREPIPVAPAVHFFMGGLAVHLNHETSLKGLYAVGECASMYHGANRLGGNSLLAAEYSGQKAAESIASGPARRNAPDFSAFLEEEQRRLSACVNSGSPFSETVIRNLVSDVMQKRMGILREENGLQEGLRDMDYYLSVSEKIRYDASVSPYRNYSLTGILILARAALTCALERRESRGAHTRTDFPSEEAACAHATLISYDQGKYTVCLDKERAYEG